MLGYSEMEIFFFHSILDLNDFIKEIDPLVQVSKYMEKVAAKEEEEWENDEEEEIED